MTQKEKIADLQQKLIQAKKHTYVYDTHTMWAENNELHIQYGSDDKLIVFDITNLYSDLSHIVCLVHKENSRWQDYLENELIQTIDKIK